MVNGLCGWHQHANEIKLPENIVPPLPPYAPNLLRHGAVLTAAKLRRLGSLWAVAAIALALSPMFARPAMAWGDEGHEIIALIAQTHLDPAVRKKVGALLAADPDPFS